MKTPEELQIELNGLAARLGAAILNRETFESEERQVRQAIQDLLAEAQRPPPQPIPSSPPKKTHSGLYRGSSNVRGEAPSSGPPPSGHMDTWFPAQTLSERTPDVRDQASASTAGPAWPSDAGLEPL